MPFRTLTFLGTSNFASDYAGPIVSSEVSEELLRTILKEVITGVQGVSLFSFQNLREDSRVFSLLAASAEATTLSPYSAWEAEISEEPGKAFSDRRSIKRAYGKIRKSGDFRVENYISEVEIESLLPEFFAQHTNRWKPVLGTSQFEDPLQQEFFRKLVAGFSSTRNILLTALYLDDHLVASHFGFFFRRRLYWYKPSHDTNFNHISPGKALLAEVYEEARRRGGKIFDFTIGDEEYKKPLSTRSVSMHTARGTQSLIASGYLGTVSILRKVKRTFTPE